MEVYILKTDFLTGHYLFYKEAIDCLNIMCVSYHIYINSPFPNCASICF